VSSTSKKIRIAAVSAIAFSFAVFIVLTALPKLQVAPPQSSLNDSVPLSPMSITLTLSPFSNPQLPRSKSNVTAKILSTCDASNVTAEILLPQGIGVVSGSLKWQGCLKANVSSSFCTTIEIIEVGNWTVSAKVRWYFTPDSWYGDIDRICIRAFNGRIEVAPAECIIHVVLP
jgi:hypothetical protein